MRVLFWFFFRENAGVAIRLMAALALGTAIMARLGAGRTAVPLLVSTVTLIACVFSWTPHLSRNLPWVLSLPISRKRLWCVNSAVNLATWLILIPMGVGIIFAHAVSLNGFDEAVALFRRALRLDAAESSEELSVQDAATAVTLIVGMLTALFGVTSRADSRSRRAWQLLSDKAVQRKWLFYLFAMGAALFVSRPIWDHGVVYFSGLVAFFLATHCHTAVNALTFTRKDRRRWAIGTAALWALLVGFVSINAVDLTRSSKPAEAAEASRYLGPYGGAISSDRITEFLKQDIGDVEIKLFGERLAARIGVKRFSTGGPPLEFHEAIRHKSSLNRLYAAASLFELKELKVTDLRLLFQHASEIKSGDDAFYYAYNFMTQDLAPEGIEAMIGSSNVLEARFGLAYSRFHPSERLMAVVQKALPTLSDEAQREALKTLSVLAGTAYRIADFEPLARGRIRPKHYGGSCADFHPQTTQAITEPDLPALNVCIREKALKRTHGDMQSVDQVGWWKLPLSAWQRSWIRWIFDWKERDPRQD